MNTKLSPLKVSKKKLKKMHQKQNNWVLDCINEEKSKLIPYSSMRDKYNKYFVVRVPKKKKKSLKPLASTNSQNKEEIIDSGKFKSFLQAKKQKILIELAQTQRRNQCEKISSNNFKQLSSQSQKQNVNKCESKTPQDKQARQSKIQKVKNQIKCKLMNQQPKCQGSTSQVKNDIYQQIQKIVSKKKIIQLQDNISRKKVETKQNQVKNQQMKDLTHLQNGQSGHKQEKYVQFQIGKDKIEQRNQQKQQQFEKQQLYCQQQFEKIENKSQTDAETQKQIENLNKL